MGHNWNHLTGSDGSRSGSARAGGLLVLWWGFGVRVLITELLAWLHEGSQLSKPQHHPSFAIPAHQTESCSDRCCLLQLFLWLLLSGQFSLECKKRTKSVPTHTNDHMQSLCQLLQLLYGRSHLRLGRGSQSGKTSGYHRALRGSL